MNAPRTIVVFRCVPLRGAELTRSACGARWDSLNNCKASAKRSVGSGHAIVGRECMECPIGKAHSNGDRPETWPDGMRIDFHDKPIPAAALVREASPGKMPKPSRAVPVPPSEPPRAPDAPAEPVAGRHGAANGPAAPIPTGGNPSDSGLPEGAVLADLEPVVLPPVEVTRKPGVPALQQPDTKFGRPVVRDSDVGASSIEAMRGRVVVVDGVSRTVDEWAKHHGLHPNSIYERVRRNWPIELACSSPRGSSYEHATAPMRVRGDGPPTKRTGHPFESTQVTHGERTLDVLAWANEIGITISAVKQRMASGLTLEAACTTPRQGRGGPRARARANATSLGDLLNAEDTRESRAANRERNRDEAASPPGVVDLLRSLAPASELPAVQLLRSAGYDVVSVVRAPAGLVIVVSNPG